MAASPPAAPFSSVPPSNASYIALAALVQEIGVFMARANQPGDSRAFVAHYIPAALRAPLNDALAQGAVAQMVADATRLALAHSGAAAPHGGGAPQAAAPPAQMLAILSTLHTDGAPTPAPHAYLPLQPLRLARAAIFPEPPLAQAAAAAATESLWQGFATGAQSLHDTYGEGAQGSVDIDMLESYIENLLLLMQRYAWCVPAAVDDGVVNVSLYDHARTSAALAAVFSALSPVEKDGRNAKRADLYTTDEPVALLVGADISGIQSFIYTITAQGATSALRGRSFYLQLLTEAVARFVLRALKLPASNLLYAGGGNLFLIARPEDGRRLAALQRQLSKVLLDHHGGDLFVAIAGAPLSGATLARGEVNTAWGALHRQLGAAKNRRFADLETADLQRLFTPQGDGGAETKGCAVCGREGGVTADKRDENAEPVYKCALCKSFEELGDALRRAHYMQLTLLPAPGEPHDEPSRASPRRAAMNWRALPAALGLGVAIYESAPPLQAPTAGRTVLLALADEALPALQPAPRRAVGRRFLVNTTPLLTLAEIDALARSNALNVEEQHSLRPDAIKPFGVLEAHARGIKRLGVLRMDVDNMGALFREGFGSSQKASLARVAGLSFAVSLFFEGWVSRIAEAFTDDNLYAIYSGGDDLFFVGSWDLVVEFSVQVRRELMRYSGGHAGIHASAGIVLVGGKYPLAQAALDAAEAEYAAKQTVWWDAKGGRQSKNAISFLGHTLPWPRFAGLEEASDATGDRHFATAQGLMRYLAEGTGTGTGTGTGAGAAAAGAADGGYDAALVGRLLALYSQYATLHEEERQRSAPTTWDARPQTPLGPWVWRSVYSLEKAGASGRQLAGALEQEYDLMERIGLAARWAQLHER